MELERSAVSGSRCSPISDDRWQERDERPNVKSHASASSPPHLLPSRLPSVLARAAVHLFTVMKECRRRGLPVLFIYTAHRCTKMPRHVFHLLFLSSAPFSHFSLVLFLPSLFTLFLGHSTLHGDTSHTAFWTCQELLASGFPYYYFYSGGTCSYDNPDDGWLNGLKNFTLCNICQAGCLQLFIKQNINHWHELG